MDGSRIRGLSQSHFRFGTGITGLGHTLHDEEKVVSTFQGLLPPRPFLGGGQSLNNPLGLFGPSPQTKSFSIESLLGLSDTVTSPGHLINFNQFQEETKPKLLRYTPYKRERNKTSHQQPQGSSDSKDSLTTRSGKAKRVRTIFTPEQLEKLESEFERQQYMVGTERSYLAESLDLTEAQVKVWFQNRRIKWRKVHLEMQQERLRALRAEEGPDFESSSDSSLCRMETCLEVRSSQGQCNDGTRSKGHRDSTVVEKPIGTRWESSGLDSYLLNTLGGSVVGSGGQWRTGRLVTSEESETESD